MTDKNSYPLDVFAIPQDKIKDWQENFSTFAAIPVIFRFFRDIKDSYYNVVRKYQGTLLGDVLMVKIKLHAEYRILLLSLWCLQFAKKNNLEPRYSEKSTIFKGIVKTGLPYRQESAEGYSNLSAETFLERIKKQGKKVLSHLKHNNGPSCYVTWFLDKERIVSLRKGLNPEEIEAGYRQKINKPIWFFDKFDFPLTGRPRNLEPAVLNTIQTISHEILAGVKIVAEKYGIVLNDKICAFIIDVTHRHLVAGVHDLEVVTKKFAKIGTCHLLGNTQGNHFLRLIGLVNAKMGGEVIGFNHGNQVAHLYDFRMETSTATQFITYTKESAKMLEKTYQIYPHITSKPAKIVGLETDMYFRLYQQNCEKPIPPAIRKIMLISTFYKVDGMCFDHDLPYLDMEMRLIQTLQKGGYQVLYKAHPDGANRWLDFTKFFGKDVIIIRDPFEQVMDQTDALLFYYYYTSTFTWAFCSNKPIVYVDCESSENIFGEAYPLIQKRCRIVKGGFDERNRYQFSEPELLRTLSEPPRKPNTEFIEKYMFPEGLSLRKESAGGQKLIIKGVA